ncbi:MAG: hypothetical protein WA817_10560, partial [Candidatus Acidiferrum sp.]
MRRLAVPAGKGTAQSGGASAGLIDPATRNSERDRETSSSDGSSMGTETRFVSLPVAEASATT